MGRSVWQRNVTGDEQLVSLHHIRWSVTRAARRVVLAVVVVSLAIAGAVAPAGARSDRSMINRSLSQADTSGDGVLTWSANAGDAALAACLAPTGNPLLESRMYAMAHVAIHDALNAIDRRYRPYAFFGHARRRTSIDAAVATAAHHVLVPVLGQIPSPPVPQTCIDAGIASVEEDYEAALDAIPNGRQKRRGIRVGAASAAAILALRADDGSDTLLVDPNYPQGDEPGEYRFTPGTPFAFAPGWGDVTPFVLRDSSQFRADPPFDVASSAYTADYRDVKRLGGDDITTPSQRTDEQTEIALFWVESSPLQWNRIARIVAADQGIDEWETARLFGLLNMALADGYIGSFETKYLYNFWRPVTAIQLAATDGNPDTVADPNWTPLVTTPPVPDHDSAHSVEGGAAAAVMRRFFGTDQISFETCSLTLPAGGTCNDASAVTRSFSSLSQAARENALSRIWVGFHFRNAVNDGIEHGRKIGNRAANLFLLPVG
jgi:PAP2 superfamily